MNGNVKNMKITFKNKLELFLDYLYFFYICCHELYFILLLLYIFSCITMSQRNAHRRGLQEEQVNGTAMFQIKMYIA